MPQLARMVIVRSDPVASVLSIRYPSHLPSGHTLAALPCERKARNSRFIPPSSIFQISEVIDTTTAFCSAITSNQSTAQTNIVNPSSHPPTPPSRRSCRRIFPVHLSPAPPCSARRLPSLSSRRWASSRPSPRTSPSTRTVSRLADEPAGVPPSRTTATSFAALPAPTPAIPALSTSRALVPAAPSPTLPNTRTPCLSTSARRPPTNATLNTSATRRDRRAARPTSATSAARRRLARSRAPSPAPAPAPVRPLPPAVPAPPTRPETRPRRLPPRIPPPPCPLACSTWAWLPSVSWPP